MRTVLILFDTLSRKYLPPYGNQEVKAPNFERLSQHTQTYDNFYCCSMPCMPARRELHTGRPNFLTRSWSPLEPFDESIFRTLQEEVYTHIITDHFHYLEVGGYGYLNQYDSFEVVRGQQGDLWKPIAGEPDYPDNLAKRAGNNNFIHDWENRKYMQTFETLPSSQVFAKSLDFLDKFKEQDDWFLMIESFDPHEPFYTTQDFYDLYPDDYDGPQFDWPDYGKDDYPEAAKEHLRHCYQAMISTVDHHLGKILDFFDEHHLWDDTALMVYTDHGFLLGEHGFMGKNITPPYEEITHLPFFFYDPRYPDLQNCRIEGLANSLNIVPTLADLFNIDVPDGVIDKPLSALYTKQETLHDALCFGNFGAQIGVADGRYTYYLTPKVRGTLYNYTLVPEHMRHYFSKGELAEAKLIQADLYGDAKAIWPILKIPAAEMDFIFDYPDLLFDIKKDPEQLESFQDPQIERAMKAKIKAFLQKYNAPKAMYTRFELDDDSLKSQ